MQIHFYVASSLKGAQPLGVIGGVKQPPHILLLQNYE